MPSLFARIRIIAGALALFLMIALPAAHAQQAPASVNPTASAVQEQQLLRELNRVQGRISIPDAKAAVLEHPRGRDWRAFHQEWLPWIGGIAIIGMVLLLAIYYLVHGTIRLKSGRSGRVIVRFNALERFLHWTMAVSFIILALTGLNISFGKRLLLPLMSPDAFATWSQWAKYTHDFISFAFVISVALLFLIWLKDNFPTEADAQWLKEGGGMIGDKHPPAWRFNAGQKILFWLVCLGTAAVAVSGYMLLFPFYITNISGMETAEVVHGVIAMAFIAMIIAHIYIGTLGMEGAFEAMGEGTVDLNWAREHHRLWVEQELAQGRGARVPPSGAATPAE
ncbi:MAG TPA: formate dehydrogenase subunit gamma [Xanthobacteraceae bacterium]|nr:formate dehydrogenase subunit gamma [Xanthobacteraceae bacterium]